MDVNVGDPISPAPENVRLPRLLGGDVLLRGYPIAIGERTLGVDQGLVKIAEDFDAPNAEIAEAFESQSYAGSLTGVYGDVDEYLKRERDSWEKGDTDDEMAAEIPLPEFLERVRGFDLNLERDRDDVGRDIDLSETDSGAEE